MTRIIWKKIREEVSTSELSHPSLSARGRLVPILLDADCSALIFCAGSLSCRTWIWISSTTTWGESERVSVSFEGGQGRARADPGLLPLSLAGWRTGTRYAWRPLGQVGIAADLHLCYSCSSDGRPGYHRRCRGNQEGELDHLLRSSLFKPTVGPHCLFLACSTTSESKLVLNLFIKAFAELSKLRELILRLRLPLVRDYHPRRGSSRGSVSHASS